MGEKVREKSEASSPPRATRVALPNFWFAPVFFSTPVRVRLGAVQVQVRRDSVQYDILTALGPASGLSEECRLQVRNRPHGIPNLGLSYPGRSGHRAPGSPFYSIPNTPRKHWSGRMENWRWCEE